MAALSAPKSRGKYRQAERQRHHGDFQRDDQIIRMP